tara:strand:+ start:2976 stop:3776 length:801 start_codon:yes stop_codon:yes gene_type:complete
MSEHPEDYQEYNLNEYLTNYQDWLKVKGYTTKKIKDHVLLARSFLMKQQPTEDEKLAEFIGIPGNGIVENFRNYWSNHDGKRVLPLNKKEKRLVQSVAARIGDTSALRLRNSALVSLLLEPVPASVRVSSLVWLAFNDLYRDDNHGGLQKFSEWPVLEIDPIFKITGVNLNTRTGKQLITLSQNASEHLSAFVMWPEGWRKVKPYWSSYLFTPIGLNLSMAGNLIEPISRQIAWRLAKRAGEDAEIKGTLYPEIMKQTPVGDEKND